MGTDGAFMSLFATAVLLCGHAHSRKSIASSMASKRPLAGGPSRSHAAEEGVSMLFASRPSCIKRLLVVEDDPLVAFDNERTLKHAGYDVVASVDSDRKSTRLNSSH